MSLIKDEWKIRILQVVSDNPEISKRGVIDKLKEQRAKATVEAGIDELERDSYLSVERGRKGQASKYRLTADGSGALRTSSVAGMVNRGMVEVAYSPDFIRQLDPEMADLVGDLQNSPMKREIMNLYVSTLRFILQGAMKKDGQSYAEYIKTLDAMFYLARMPEIEAQRIRGAMEFKAFGSYLDALNFAMSYGLKHLKDVLEAGLHRNPDLATTTLFVTRFDPGRGYVDARDKLRATFGPMPAEEVKKIFLEKLLL
jgi:hypothetical protein